MLITTTAHGDIEVQVLPPEQPTENPISDRWFIAVDALPNVVYGDRYGPEMRVRWNGEVGENDLRFEEARI